MFHTRVGEAVRLRGSYEKNGVGVNVSCTFAYTDESGNLTNSLSGVAGALAGEVYYVLTPDAAGIWFFRFSTTGDVDKKDISGVIAVEAALTTARAGNLDRLDVLVSTRLATAGYTAPPSAGVIADIVWDTTASEHLVAGTMGEQWALVPSSVWSAGTRTLTSLTALASQIASAVWDALKSSYVGLTTMGGAMNAAGSASDPLLNTVPGSYTQGMAGFALGRIGTGQIEVIATISPDGSKVSIVRGDSYLADDSEALEWENLDGTWPDLEASPAPDSITMTIKDTLNGVVVTAAAEALAARRVSVDLDAETTEAMRCGEHEFDLEARWDSGRVRTLVRGTLTVLEDMTPAPVVP